MSRNRYTKAVRKDERARHAHQEKYLSAIAKTLRHVNTDFEAPVPISKAKDRRSTRLEHKRRHKSDRLGAADASQP
jgi:hypothetical protein